jgi:hypothetical protein
MRTRGFNWGTAAAVATVASAVVAVLALFTDIFKSIRWDSSLQTAVAGVWFGSSDPTNPRDPGLHVHADERYALNGNGELVTNGELVISRQPGTPPWQMTCAYLFTGKWTLRDRTLTMTFMDFRSNMTTFIENGLALSPQDASARGLACPARDEMPTGLSIEGRVLDVSDTELRLEETTMTGAKKTVVYRRTR